MIVKRFLFCNLEHKTPVVKVENGYKKQGRGVLGLVLLAVFGVFFGGTAWGQTPDYLYYCMHCNGKGYLKQYKGIIGNDGTFHYENVHHDNGSSMWVYSDGYLQQEMYYLNVINNQTLVLSTTPVTQWDTILDGDKQRFQMRGSAKILGLDANKNVVLAENPTNKYAACKLTVTHTNKWEGPKDVSWTVQSPQLVTYLRVYYLRNITVSIDKNDAGTVNVNVVNGKDSRCHCRLTYADTQPSSTDGWNINTTTGVIYNTTTSQKTVKKSFSLEPLDPIVLSEHSATTATVTIKVNAKAFTPESSKKYLLFNTESDNYRFPKTTSTLSEGALLPVNGTKSDLEDPINGDIAWEVEVDDEGFYSFKNVGTGRYFYYDAADYTVSNYGAVKLGSAAPGSDTRYKFRLYSGCGNRDPFGSCLYIIPYEKQFAVWKSDGVLGEHYFALYMNTSNSTKIASITKTSEQAKWKIYSYEWQYRLWSDYSINGNHELYDVGSYPYTASTWFSRNIKDSPANSDYCLLPGSKTHDGITYSWTLTDLNDYISTNATLASGISTLTATVNSLPPGIRSGTLSVTASVTTPANTNLSNSKTILVTLYNLNPSFEEISSLSDITNTNGLYKLTADNTYSNSNKPDVSTFSGILDCDGHTVSGLSAPLFTTLTNGTVRNLNLKNVHISQDGNVGAIAGIVNGVSRIYNCGIRPTDSLHISNNPSTIASSDNHNCGSLVGLLDGTARVINCFSYAWITQGGGGDYYVGGLVGNNSQVSKQADLKTIVVNCMFYGNIDTIQCQNFAPVYGNNAIKNDAVDGINPYCFFSEKDGTFSKKYLGTGYDINSYNRSWPVAEQYLTRFEYYRSILNSNRQLMAWWVSGNVNDTALISKWVLDPSIAPYPILKKWGKYPSIINPDPNRVWDTASGDWVLRTAASPYQGKKLGTLSVKVLPGSHAASGVPASKDTTLTITDMDTLNYDYCYYKVQLPYYNELFGNCNSTDHDIRYGGNYTDSVVTGWKITSVTRMNPDNDTVCFEGPWSETGRVRYRKNTKAWESGFNFADRKCTSKDLYVTSGRVFAQGGYYYVPDSVTAITIEAYWGKAIYMRNLGNNVDLVNLTNHPADGNIKEGKPFVPAGTLTPTFQGQTVFTDWRAAVKDGFTGVDAAGLSNTTVYDRAIVLVGNFQLRNENGPVGTDIPNLVGGSFRPYTIMSVDFDLDNEPDYCFELQFRRQWGRPGIQPIRFDFLTVPELGMGVRHNENQNTIGIFIPQGHFEITETSYMHTTQFEYDFGGDKVESPVILNGGHFEQIVVRRGKNQRTSYFIMGGHFRMLRFSPGAHTTPDTGDNGVKTRHCAVNVIGGEYPEFYLSGIYKPDQPVNTDNPHCYTNGGRFGIIAGAGYEPIKGDVTFKIDHSIIDEFYGGGINAAQPVTGSIDVTIDHGIVGKYCGGPKVGVMTDGKTVTTHATETIFTMFYGGGNGGTSYYRKQGYDGNSFNIPNPSDSTGWAHFGTNSVGYTDYDRFNPLNTRTGNSPLIAVYNDSWGYHALYEFECFVESNGLGENPTIRTYTHWADFGSTKTGNVTNVLNNCTIKENFYGGGNLGDVSGWVKSTLTDCTIMGNVFGGGFSNKIEPFRIHDKGQTHFPYIDKAGVMQNGLNSLNSLEYIDREYTWCYKNNSGQMFPQGVVIPSWANTSTGRNATFEYPEGSNKWYVLTKKSLENLGAVSDSVTLTINGKSTIGTLENGVVKHGTGNVFGGGDESAVGGSTLVKILDRTRVFGNIYGGGNRGKVTGDTKVIINGEVPETGNSATGGSGNNN